MQINTGDVSEEELAARREKAMADPQIQNILTDPVMRQVSFHVLEWLTLQWVGPCRCLTGTCLLRLATSAFSFLGNPSAVHELLSSTFIP